MKIVKIKNEEIFMKSNANKNKYWLKFRSKFNFNITQIILIINIIINIYLLIKDNKNSKLISKILDFNGINFNNDYPDDDKEIRVTSS